jgi:tRNA dimethylallyltransferase
MSDYNLITVLGPTASGKTLFGAHLADALSGEIISADSRQVYKGMDLGTGKDYDDYIVSGETIPVHLVDIHEAGYKYNLFEFQEDFIRTFVDIQTREKVPIMVGGTGMYIEAILDKYQLVKVPLNMELRNDLEDKSQKELAEILISYDTDLHNTTDLKIRKRTIRAIEIADYYSRNPMHSDDQPEIRSLIFGVKYDRNSRRKKITQRLKARLNEGMIEEVRSLLERIPPDDLIYYGLEYKFLTLHLTGQLNYQEMFNKLEVAIHQFAKRQMTWFRKMERHGFDIHWLDGHIPLDEKIKKSVKIIRKEAPELLPDL